MRILFFYPNLFGMNMLPPAIGYFTSILKQFGHKTKLFDTTIYKGLFDSIDTDKMKSENLNARPFDDTLLIQNSKPPEYAEKDFDRMVENFLPDVIIMSCTEDMYPVGVELLKRLKNKPFVIAGGVFPTFAPELTLELSNGTIDLVLRGEGERTLPEILEKLKKGEDFTNIPGVFCKIKDKLINNPLPEPIDIDNEQPLPDYSLFPETRFYRPMQGKLRRMLPVTTSRGCLFTCAYCNSPSQKNIHKQFGFNFFRKPRIKTVYNELNHIIKKYEPDSIYFWADTFLVWDDKEFEEFCEMYSEFNLPFWIQTRAETVTSYKFKKLQDIGLLRVAFGIEHGNANFRKKILNRKISNQEIIEKLKIVTDLEIPISVNNIIGFPYETRKLAFDTIELNRKINSDGINAYSFTPFHGTPLRKLSEHAGFFSLKKLARCINKPTMLTMPQFSKSEIEGIRRCFVLYVKMPRNRWQYIKEAEKLTKKGNRIWENLKQECLEKFMNFGDYEKEDDMGTIDYEDN